eukprot:TRINITY_DN2089_c0_g5_i1.p2 TRINITY_DN2089_c0_g5~~TRINITY_DN2089_c0_g5_i1.p2  ORF type:complete len:124 (-),score=3.19 TRINITY_DN2089_c0_g5_i1:318-689(-)
MALAVRTSPRSRRVLRGCDRARAAPPSACECCPLGTPIAFYWCIGCHYLGSGRPACTRRAPSAASSPPAMLASLVVLALRVVLVLLVVPGAGSGPVAAVVLSRRAVRSPPALVGCRKRAMPSM